MSTLANHDAMRDAVKTATRLRTTVGRKTCVLAMTAAGVTAGLLSLAPTQPVLVWNYTASVPVGLYWIADAQPSRGAIVAIQPRADLAATLETIRHPLNRLLLKPLAATSGDRVCRNGEAVTINGAIAAKARLHSSGGSILPVWSGCHTLAGDQIVVISDHPNSFDSRYFGPVNQRQVVGVAHPLVLLPTGEPH
ncbi:MAG: S26 family signal peptidase [Hyphomonadaceae bacterium]|nr:S26 family signal peptidase [Hyphomonadaceae bacterium]